MENPFILAALISFCYLIIKFSEMRIIDKENKPLKNIIKDMFLVYFSCVISLTRREQALQRFSIRGLSQSRRTLQKIFVSHSWGLEPGYTLHYQLVITYIFWCIA